MDESTARRLLGVGRAASPPELAHAWRQRARATHPDVRPNDPKAAAMFAEVEAAYRQLRGRSHELAKAVSVQAKGPAAPSNTYVDAPVWLGWSR